MSLMAETISIIIPTYYSKALDTTLRAIAKQCSINRVCEIIVVGQQDIISFTDLPQLRYIHVKENPSPAHNRNCGAMHARGDWICFTDSDCIPNTDWIGQLIRAFDTNVVAVAGAVDLPTGMTYWSWCDHLLAFDRLVVGMRPACQIDFAATLNFCLRRDLFISLGGFDESFPGAAGEDLDFCWRLRQAGHSITFVPEAIVKHYHSREDFYSAWQHLYRYGEATSQFRLKRGHSVAWRVWIQFAKRPFVGELAGLARVALRAIVRLRLLRILSYAWFLPGIVLLDLAHTLGMMRRIRSYAT